MAGFGGGSTYIALLAISGLPLAAIPVIALTCNLIVSSQGSLLLIKRGHAKWPLLLPLLAGSVPSAYFGGSWRLPEATFIVILTIALTLAGTVMLLQGKLPHSDNNPTQKPSTPALFGTGVLLGLLAGVTGIGGGIYLAPIMHLMKWARAQTIATCTSLFIALNSLAGLAGHLTKGTPLAEMLPLSLFIACPVAVLFGGYLGTSLLANKLSSEKVRTITAVVILLVACRLWLKIALG